MTEADPCSSRHLKPSSALSCGSSPARPSARARRPMLSPTAACCAALAVASATGCGRTVFVHESTPMRVGPMTKGRVYLRIADEWVLSSNAVPIPEGWYIVPPSFVDEESAE